jgi:hypothetical protein
MSILGFLSDKLDREQTVLQELNEALLGLQAEAVGRASDLGYEKETLAALRARLAEFIARLQREIENGERENGSPSPIVARLKENRAKPLGDWKEDLAQLQVALQTDATLPDELAGLVEELIDILDVQLTKDFSRLYSR